MLLLLSRSGNGGAQRCSGHATGEVGRGNGDFPHDSAHASRMTQVMPQTSDLSTPAASMTPGIFCKQCGYALVGLPGRTCPECGREFDPANRRTFARRPPRGWVWRWGRRLAVVVLVSLLAAGTGLLWLWWGWQAEQPTIGKLTSLGATTLRTPIGPDWLARILGDRYGYLRDRVKRVELSYRSAAEIEALDLKSLGRVETFSLWRCGINDRVLANMGELSALQELNLSSDTLESQSLAFLSKLPRLSRLRLWGTWVTDEGFAPISAIKQLKQLFLNSTAVTDAGLKHLQTLNDLQLLSLTGTPITDDGLEHLKGLKSLRILEVPYTRVTAAGVAKLKGAIPGLALKDTKGRFQP